MIRMNELFVITKFVFKKLPSHQRRYRLPCVLLWPHTRLMKKFHVWQRRRGNSESTIAEMGTMMWIKASVPAASPACSAARRLRRDRRHSQMTSRGQLCGLDPAGSAAKRALRDAVRAVTGPSSHCSSEMS